MNTLTYGSLTCNILPDDYVLPVTAITNQNVYSYLTRSISSKHNDEFIAIITRRYNRIPWGAMTMSSLYSDNARLRQSRFQHYLLNIFENNRERREQYYRLVTSYLVWLYYFIQDDVSIDFEATLSTLTEFADMLGTLENEDDSDTLINGEVIDILIMILLALESKEQSQVFMDKMVEFSEAIFYYFDRMSIGTQQKISDYCKSYTGYFSDSPLFYTRQYLLQSESIEVRRNIKMAIVLG